jgi:molybdenum cofactor synthesis domain-containing protein
VGTRAAFLVIGNEILTGKVVEENVPFLARELFGLGITLARIVVCADDEGVIAADVRTLREAHDLVFTSGGVGPTHDDVTIPAIARAFGRRLVRDAVLEGRIREHFGARTTEGHLRMAEMPEGGELVASAKMSWPVLRVENVWVLPGVPQIFRLKFGLVRDRLARGEPFQTRAVFTRCDEGEIAALLAEVEARFAGVAIGSYPRLDDPDYTVKVTIDGRDAPTLDAALAALLAGLPPDKIVRIER